MKHNREGLAHFKNSGQKVSGNLCIMLCNFFLVYLLTDK